jgi:UDP-glucose 4-epimerase
MTKRVLVTGGAGFIGSHLVEALLARGEAVTVLDDFSVGLRANLEQAQRSGDVKIIAGSVANEAAVISALKGCDRVYHLAVQCVRRSLGRPRESHDTNATGTLIVLEDCRRRGVERFVYCSSSEVYGNASDGRLQEDVTLCRPTTVYGAAKLAGELYVDAYATTYGLPTTIVRPFNAYGPRAYQFGTRAEVVPRMVGRVLNGLPPLLYGSGDSGRDFTYVSEVAEGILKVGESDAARGEKINIAFGRMITVRDVAATVLRALGRNDLRLEFGPPRPGDIHRLHADNQKAERLLQFRPKISFEDGLRRYVDWVRSRYPDPSVLLDQKPVNWSMPDDMETATAEASSRSI